MIDPTVASTFRLASKHTLLIDEVDNMSIIRSMRSVLNDGHSFGGCVTRVAPNKEVISYPVFGPVAIAGIGKIPASLASRSLVIRLHRSDKHLDRFKAQENYFASELVNWAEQANLDPNPKLPAQLVGREADKWRPLIAIADSFDRGAIAREVALTFLNESDPTDLKELLLRDTEKVFSSVKTKMITTEVLYQKLLEDKDGEFELDYAEHKITKTRISHILADFQIKNRNHRYGKTVQRSWFREDFEEMWRRYSG
jgi:hypothetical protein